MISWEGVVLQTKVKPQTKGTVLLVCWKCTDILLFASKHAKACPYVMMQFFMFLFFPQYLSIDPYFCADFLYSVGVMPVCALKCL